MMDAIISRARQGYRIWERGRRVSPLPASGERERTLRARVEAHMR